MNFVHLASLALTSSSDHHQEGSNKGSKKGAGEYTFYRVTVRQVSVQDPNIGCGHQIKLVNEWVLRKALYTRHLQQEG